MEGGAGMRVKKICLQCGIEYEVPHWRKNSKYCSTECRQNSLKAQANVTCSICGKSFHLKPSHINRFKGELGFCCSKECTKEQMRIRMTGKGNHQYGLKGELNASFKQGSTSRKNNKLNETMVYVGDWYKKNNENGRVTENRYLVELNHSLYDECFFEEIDNWFYLRDGYEVHHKDLNHNNNSLDNLDVLTKSEHISLHNRLRDNKRDVLGRFKKM